TSKEVYKHNSEDIQETKQEEKAEQIKEESKKEEESEKVPSEDTEIIFTPPTDNEISTEIDKDTIDEVSEKESLAIEEEAEQREEEPIKHDQLDGYANLA